MAGCEQAGTSRMKMNDGGEPRIVLSLIRMETAAPLESAALRKTQLRLGWEPGGWTFKTRLGQAVPGITYAMCSLPWCFASQVSLACKLLEARV